MRLPGYDQPAVGGTSMTSLLANFETRASQWIAPASFEPTIYVLCGGTQDILDGDSGTQIYADAGALADAARAAGAQYVICTTVFPAVPFTGPQEAARVAANALILADASSKFDAEIDFEVEGLDDPADPRSYFFDGVHLIGSHADLNHGTGRAAVVARPAIAEAILTLTGIEV
jgi:hypothetical protein